MNADLIIDVIKDALIDNIKILPFLFPFGINTAMENLKEQKVYQAKIQKKMTG